MWFTLKDCFTSPKGPCEALPVTQTDVIHYSMQSVITWDSQREADFSIKSLKSHYAKKICVLLFSAFSNIWFIYTAWQIISHFWACCFVLWNVSMWSCIHRTLYFRVHQMKNEKSDSVAHSSDKCGPFKSASPQWLWASLHKVLVRFIWRHWVQRGAFCILDPFVEGGQRRLKESSPLMLQRRALTMQ